MDAKSVMRVAIEALDDKQLDRLHARLRGGFTLYCGEQYAEWYDPEHHCGCVCTLAGLEQWGRWTKAPFDLWNKIEDATFGLPMCFLDSLASLTQADVSTIVNEVIAERVLC